MSLLRLVISITALIASGHTSGIGHIVPAIKSLSVVRYAPFYSFPNGVRSIHAIAPAVRAVAPLAPVLPALPAVPAPVFPAPAPVFPGPAPVLSAPGFSAPAPVFPAPAPVFPAAAPVFPAPAPAPVYPAPIFRALPAPVPAPVLPVHTYGQAAFLPSVAPVPSVLQAAPVYTRALHAPFSPVVRPVAPAFVPAPIPHFAKPYSFPAPFLPAPVIKHAAWK